MKDAGSHMTRAPKCDACKKSLVWEVAHTSFTKLAPSVRVPDGWRKSYQAFRRESSRLAIRCLFCLHVYCRRCATKHFQPRIGRINRTEKVLDRILAGIIEANRAKLAACGKISDGAVDPHSLEAFLTGWSTGGIRAATVRSTRIPHGRDRNLDAGSWLLRRCHGVCGVRVRRGSWRSSSGWLFADARASQVVQKLPDSSTDCASRGPMTRSRL
jgi:hypothetical protein